MAKGRMGSVSLGSRVGYSVRGGGVACLQVSHLLTGCRGLLQSNDLQELGAGPSCLLREEKRHRMYLPWG